MLQVNSLRQVIRRNKADMADDAGKSLDLMRRVSFKPVLRMKQQTLCALPISCQGLNVKHHLYSTAYVVSIRSNISISDLPERDHQGVAANNGSSHPYNLLASHRKPEKEWACECFRKVFRPRLEGLWKLSTKLPVVEILKNVPWIPSRL